MRTSIPVNDYWICRLAAFPTVACYVLAASLAPAQGVVAPFRLGLVNPIPGLASAVVGVGSVVHASFVHLPSDPPGVFYGALTVTGLSPTMGGVGTIDLLCGHYNAAADVFIPNNDAAALNTGGHDQLMSVRHDGLFAVFDRQNSWPRLASRSAIGQPWQVVGPIGNVPPGQSTFNPSLVLYRGQPHLVFNYLSGIAMQPIDLAAPQLTGPLYQPMPIVNGSGGQAFAGQPITDTGGEILGLSYCELMGTSRTDHYVALDLDPVTPGMLLLAAPSNTHYTGCAFVGGMFIDVQYPGSYLFAIDAAWCTGGRAPVGGAMDVRILTPPTQGASIYASVIGGGSSYLPLGVSAPGIQGLLGLNPIGWISALAVHDNANGEAVVRLVVPNSPTLSGLSVPAQSLTWDITSGTAFLGNTARFSVD